MPTPKHNDMLLHYPLSYWRVPITAYISTDPVPVESNQSIIIPIDRTRDYYTFYPSIFSLNISAVTLWFDPRRTFSLQISFGFGTNSLHSDPVTIRNGRVYEPALIQGPSNQNDVRSQRISTPTNVRNICISMLETPFRFHENITFQVSYPGKMCDFAALRWVIQFVPFGGTPLNPHFVTPANIWILPDGRNLVMFHLNDIEIMLRRFKEWAEGINYVQRKTEVYHFRIGIELRRESLYATDMLLSVFSSSKSKAESDGSHRKDRQQNQQIVRKYSVEARHQHVPKPPPGRPKGKRPSNLSMDLQSLANHPRCRRQAEWVAIKR